MTRPPHRRPDRARSCTSAPRSAAAAGGDPTQQLAADLGAAAAAAHRLLALHRGSSGMSLVHAHPAPVDPVLPTPNRPTGHRDSVAPRQRTSVAEADDGQCFRLWVPAARLPPSCGTPKVRCQRGAGADCPDAGFRPWVGLDRGTVAGGEDGAVADAAESRVDPDATGGSAGEPGVGEARRHPPRPSPIVRCATSRKRPSDSTSRRRRGVARDPAGRSAPGSTCARERRIAA